MIKVSKMNDCNFVFSSQVLYLENCGLQEKLDSLTERLDRESIVTVGQDRYDDHCHHSDDDNDNENDQKYFLCRSLGAGSEDVDGLTLTSIRSTTSSASKVKLQKVKVKNEKRVNVMLATCQLLAWESGS